jgi:serine/threonine-protein kinase CHEK2
VPAPTQAIQGLDDIEDDDAASNASDESNVWGRLLSVNKLFPSTNLIENDYTFGRATNCTIAFDNEDFRASKHYLAYSSTHFKIIRDQVKNHVFIKDLSSNGTYINGDKIGKNKLHVLVNNAEIALASKTHRVYVYIDAKATEDSTIPEIVREKYVISKEIGRGAYGEVRLCFTRGKNQDQ